MELYWIIDIQHVSSGWNNQDVRSYRKGDDGIVIMVNYFCVCKNI